MAINSVSSGYSSVAAIQATQNQPQISEREGDGDRDDSAAAISQNPTVNTSGQVVGSLINVQA
jgi:hypothetical protein